MQMDLFPEERRKIIKNWSSYSQIKNLKESIQIRIHDVPIRFESNNIKLIDELSSFFPIEWSDKSAHRIRVSWVAPDESMTKNKKWDEISDPNCQFYKNFVSQRDFLSCQQNSNHYFLIAEEKIDDGFFNFLRYLLPVKLLENNKILFHSSCVISSQDEAFLFFGPSGVGKTTMAELCKERCNVLGDDMNLLTFEKNKIFVEAATVGQRIYDQANFGQRYPLRSAFWLNKSLDYSHEKIQSGQLKYFLSSFANIFWDQLSPKSYEKVFDLVKIMKMNIVLYQLNFKKEKDVWNYVSAIG